MTFSLESLVLPSPSIFYSPFRPIFGDVRRCSAMFGDVRRYYPSFSSRSILQCTSQIHGWLFTAIIRSNKLDHVSHVTFDHGRQQAILNIRVIESGLKSSREGKFITCSRHRRSCSTAKVDSIHANVSMQRYGFTARTALALHSTPQQTSSRHCTWHFTMQVISR